MILLLLACASEPSDEDDGRFSEDESGDGACSSPFDLGFTDGCDAARGYASNCQDIPAPPDEDESEYAAGFAEGVRDCYATLSEWAGC